MEKRVLRRIGLVVFTMGLFWAAASLSLSLFGDKLPAFLKTDWGMFAVNLLMYAAAALILWLFLRRLPKIGGEPRRKMSAAGFLGYACSMRGAAMILSMIGTVFFLLFTVIMKGPGNLMEKLAGSGPLFPEGMPSLATYLILICAVAPVAEEIMFRRLLLDALRPFGDKIAVLYSGIAFGLLHMNTQQIFYASGLGLMLGYAMVKTNNLKLCVGLHAAVNISSAAFLPMLYRFAEIMSNGNYNPYTAFSDGALLVTALVFLGLILLTSVVGVILFFVHIKKVRLSPPQFSFSVPVTVKTAFLSMGSIPYALVCAAMSLYSIYSS